MKLLRHQDNTQEAPAIVSSEKMFIALIITIIFVGFDFILFFKIPSLR